MREKSIAMNKRRKEVKRESIEADVGQGRVPCDQTRGERMTPGALIGLCTVFADRKWGFFYRRGQYYAQHFEVISY